MTETRPYAIFFTSAARRRLDQLPLPVATAIFEHDTRRTCGSLLAALDLYPRVVMQILRHSKIAITMEIYTEVPDASTREALRALGSQLDG